MKGTLREVCISLLGAAAAGSLILGLTRLIDPLGTQELVVIWVVGAAIASIYPLLMRPEPTSSLPPGTILLAAMGLLIFSNVTTDHLVVPGCLSVALWALRSRPEMIRRRGPVTLALAGAVIDFVAGIFWNTGAPGLQQVSWYAGALGSALVFAGFAIAAGRPRTRGYGVANIAFAVAALGVAGGWMAESIWELIARVYVPFGNAYLASAYPAGPWTGPLTGSAYLMVTIGLLLLMSSSTNAELERNVNAARRSSGSMSALRHAWSGEFPIPGPAELGTRPPGKTPP